LENIGKPFDALWCCTGTGSEEYAKLTDTIYFHDDDSLYVNLYIDSDLEWPEKNLRIRQQTTFPQQQGTTLLITARTPVQLSVNLRIPYWVQEGKVKVNGETIPAFASPGSYLTLNRTWKTGDKIELRLPMALHVAPMPDDETIQAVMYGPLVLAGRFEEVGSDLRYGDYGPKPKSQSKVPEITVDTDRETAWVEPDSKQPLTFHAVGQSQPIALVPLYQIIRERYAVYWKVHRRSTQISAGRYIQSEVDRYNAGLGKRSLSG